MLAEHARLLETDRQKRQVSKAPLPPEPHVAVDNRLVWQIVLSPDFRAGPARRSNSFVELRKLIRIYFSVLDGECAVERDLGAMTAEKKEHGNANAQLLSDILVLRTSGPAHKKDFCNEEAAGDVKITDFARGSLQLWRKTVGARFGRYKPRAQPARKNVTSVASAAPTYASVRRGVLRAAESERRMHFGAVTLSDPLTVHGVRRSAFARAATDGVQESSGFWNSGQARFKPNTEKKRLGTIAARAKRHTGGSPFPTFVERRAGSIPQPAGGVARVCFAGIAESYCERRPHAVVSGTHRCYSADLVIVGNLAEILAPTTDDCLVHAAYIVGLGRRVTTARAWKLAKGRPDQIPAEDRFFCRGEGEGGASRQVASALRRGARAARLHQPGGAL